MIWVVFGWANVFPEIQFGKFPGWGNALSGGVITQVYTQQKLYRVIKRPFNSGMGFKDFPLNRMWAPGFFCHLR